MSTQIINDLEKYVPKVRFESGKSFYWSPETMTITYNEKLINNKNGKWSLLHEAAHAKLKHLNYSSDLGLLRLEVAAWDKAKEIASSFGLDIDENHIQDCLDTYRDWLHRRSTCPECGVICLQDSPTTYSCYNCYTKWSVSASRFCRPYRLKLENGKEKRSQSTIATFS